MKIHKLQRDIDRICHKHDAPYLMFVFERGGDLHTFANSVDPEIVGKMVKAACAAVPNNITMNKAN